MTATALTPVRVRIERHTILPGSAARVFDWLADIPTSVRCFPQVMSCDPLPDPHTGTNAGWRVGMQPRQVALVRVVTIYACAYSVDRTSGIVRWQPLAPHWAPDANARMSGCWSLELAKPCASANGQPGLAARLEIDGEIGLPLPALATTLAAPLVQGEFSHMADAYVQRVRQALAATG